MKYLNLIVEYYNYHQMSILIKNNIILIWSSQNFVHVYFNCGLFKNLSHLNICLTYNGIWWRKKYYLNLFSKFMFLIILIKQCAFASYSDLPYSNSFWIVWNEAIKKLNWIESSHIVSRSISQFSLSSLFKKYAAYNKLISTF